MGKGRLEAFSDGMIAIIITIMVLELKVPHGTGFELLSPLVPVLLSYVLSFIYVAIYWNNHHHMISTVERVSGRILWANLHLLFWLSLIPFATGWVGENTAATAPVAVYGGVLLMAAISYSILQRTIIDSQGEGSVLKKAVGRDWKGRASPVLYASALLVSFKAPALAMAIYVLVALLWFIPDRRIERIQSPD